MTVSALACAIAKGKTDKELELLSAFFTQLGDSLATIEACNTFCCGNNERKAAVDSNDTINIT